MPKQMPKVTPKIQTVDDKLTEHLAKAEEHLIAAVKLFGRKTPPDRHANYLERLVRAQEGVTTLLREELVRIRGPIRVRVGKK
jgi:hypothetical protein